MRRRLFMTLSALSLLLWAAVVVLFVRSQSAIEIWQFSTGEGLFLSLNGNHEEITFHCITRWPEARRFDRVRYAELKDLPERSLPIADVHPLAGSYTSHSWDLLGIAFEAGGMAVDTDLNGQVLRVPPYPEASERVSSPPLPNWSVSAAWWSLLVLFGMLPTSWVVSRLWTRRLRRSRLASARCVICGYDLRATPDRCPECGAKSEPVQAPE